MSPRHNSSPGEPHAWGLFSDVHGNLPALQEAVSVLRAAGADRLACLGDVLGRGNSDGCVKLIQQVADIALLGNRDLDWQDRVAPSTRAWVRALPRTACVDGLLLAHGDPRLTRTLSTAQIGRDFHQAFTGMEARQARVLAFGHSHHARIWRKASRDAAAVQLHESCVMLDAEARFVVNVGTTGLPFPGKGGPSVALVDLRAETITQLPLTWRQPRR